jgi:cytosine deaminase
MQVTAPRWAISNAALPGRPGRWTVTVEGRDIVTVDERPPHDVAQTWDAGGRLVSPAFVDAHVHLDKALTSDRLTDSAALLDLSSKIRAIREIKSGFSVDDVQARATRGLSMGLAHGTTSVRSHCEADRHTGYRSVQGLRNAAQAMAGLVDLQLVAFPQEGWFDVPGTLEDGAGSFVAQAVQDGVRVVGGNVNAKLWPSDPQRQVDETFALAMRHDCDIDYHLDNWDGPDAFTLPYVAQKTIDCGWQGRVTAGHIISLAHVDNAVAADTIDLVKKAGLNVCVLPSRIRLTRVAELLEAGVNVVCGTDNLRDSFMRFGDADPLRALLLLGQLTRQLSDPALERLWSTMTGDAARMLRLPDYGLAPGAKADLIVIDAASAPEAILLQSARLAVVKAGVQVAGPVKVTA